MSTSRFFQSSRPVVTIRGIHLDLKGVPPTANRLLELLELFAAAGYNAVLVEWEDAFPWSVDERFRSETAYSREDIRRFCEVARKLDIELIPLVQCLGHMETPLRVTGYEHLREVPYDSYVLNPLAKGARELVQRMVDDVVALMPGLRHLHLGGDEAWSLGNNPATAGFVAKFGKGALYLQHVEPILDSLNERNIRPILWHDMMIEWDSPALESLAGKADLQVWGYRGHPDQSTSHYNSRHVQRLHEHGFTLWGGTAYKGADGHNSDLPDLAERRLNATAWVEVARRFNFAGVIATGWSRYSTHRIQCEPIDAALDSLVIVGRILHDGEVPKDVQESALALLEDAGEKEDFLACQSSMKKLTAARARGWQAVQSLREQLAISQRDAHRRGSSWEARYLRMLRDAVEDADAVAEEVRSALEGSVEPVWIDEYITSRLGPLRAELECLDPLVREMDPESWEAERSGAMLY